MSDFMEVFTVTHMTYVCVFPMLVLFVGVALMAAGQLVTFQSGNIPLCIFLMLTMIMAFGKVSKTLNEDVPYFEDRMIQFQGKTIYDKLD
jgi:hypothetical protein